MGDVWDTTNLDSGLDRGLDSGLEFRSPGVKGQVHITQSILQDAELIHSMYTKSSSCISKSGTDSEGCIVTAPELGEENIWKYRVAKCQVSEYVTIGSACAPPQKLRFYII